MAGRRRHRAASFAVTVMVVAATAAAASVSAAAPASAPAPAGTLPTVTVLASPAGPPSVSTAAPDSPPDPPGAVTTFTVSGTEDPVILPWHPQQAKGSPDSYKIQLFGDVGAGNMSLAGGLRQAQMCFWRPNLSDGPVPDSTLRRIAARRGVLVPDADARHTLANLVGAPEYEWDPATWSAGGMAERLYGVRVAWPSVTDLMVPRRGSAPPAWPELTCARGPSATPSPAYWAAVEAEWPPAKARDALFLRPGLLAAVAYQFVHINRAAPAPQHSPRLASVVGLPTWFWVNTAAYPTVQVTAAYHGNHATVLATPRLVLTFSGGPEDGTLECGGTGTPYRTGDDSTCSHTFHAMGTYRVTAQVTYDLVWLRDSAPKETLPSETSQPAVSNLQVREVQILGR